MEIHILPCRKDWSALLRRDAVASVHDETARIVADVFDHVAKEGDKAVKEYEKKFTGADRESLKVADAEITEAERLTAPELREAIEKAAENIAAFHGAQAMKPIEVETAPGVVCMQRQMPIDTVGLYVPGGNSPLFSTILMLGVPARIAGCRRVVMATPAGADGKVHPAILYAAKVAGVTDIYAMGGAQAVAAMALGTESVPRVHKIFGPGNRFVMEAKQLACYRQGTALDMPAGPSEVMVIADKTASPAFIAADFLSQAEHGPDSQSILVTDSREVLDATVKEIEKQLAALPRREMMGKSLEHSRLIQLGSMDDVLDFANEYAPEHLIINTENADELAAGVKAAGSVFIGPWSTESAGDYASGTNHTLPTSGYATAYSGVNLDSFCKKITYQRLTPEGVKSLAKTVMTMAKAESLEAHSRAMEIRYESL